MSEKTKSGNKEKIVKESKGSRPKSNRPSTNVDGFSKGTRPRSGKPKQ